MVAVSKTSKQDQGLPPPLSPRNVVYEPTPQQQEVSDLWRNRRLIHLQLHRLFASRDDPVRRKTPVYTGEINKSIQRSDTDDLGCELTYGLANHADTGWETIDEIEARRRRKLWRALDELRESHEDWYDVVVTHARYHTKQDQQAADLGISTRTVSDWWLAGLDFVLASTEVPEKRE